MDQFSGDYRVEDYNQETMEEGDYKVKIVKVDPDAVAKSSGNPMIVLEFGIAQASFTFRYNLVKNEHFNANATKFFDCFKIPRGNFEYQRWMGRIGSAHIAKGKVKDNGKSYWEVQYLIVDNKAQATAPRPVAPPPAAPQPVIANDFPDDIPF